MRDDYLEQWMLTTIEHGGVQAICPDCGDTVTAWPADGGVMVVGLLKQMRGHWWDRHEDVD